MWIKRSSQAAFSYCLSHFLYKWVRETYSMTFKRRQCRKQNPTVSLLLKDKSTCWHFKLLGKEILKFLKEFKRQYLNMFSKGTSKYLAHWKTSNGLVSDRHATLDSNTRRQRDNLVHIYDLELKWLVNSWIRLLKENYLPTILIID